MRITTQSFAGFTILHLRGELDTFESLRLAKEIDYLTEAGADRIALNLWLVRFVNSTALGTILRASKELVERGGKLVISQPSVFCQNLFRKIRLDLAVSIYPSDEEAGAALEGGVALDEDGSELLFSPCDPSRVSQVLNGAAPADDWCGVGRITALGPNGLRFSWQGNDTHLTPFEMGQLLALGTEVRVKYHLRQPDQGNRRAVVTVVEVHEQGSGVDVVAVFRDRESDAGVPFRVRPAADQGHAAPDIGQDLGEQQVS